MDDPGLPMPFLAPVLARDVYHSPDASWMSEVRSR